MVSLFALYRRPVDEVGFITHYETVHVPLAKRLPNLQDIRWGRLMGDDSPWFWVAEMRFQTVADLKAAMRSPAGQKAAEDLAGFADGLFTMRTVEWQ